MAAAPNTSHPWHGSMLLQGAHDVSGAGSCSCKSALSVNPSSSNLCVGRMSTIVHAAGLQYNTGRSVGPPFLWSGPSAPCL